MPLPREHREEGLELVQTGFDPMRGDIENGVELVKNNKDRMIALRCLNHEIEPLFYGVPARPCFVHRFAPARVGDLLQPLNQVRQIMRLVPFKIDQNRPEVVKPAPLLDQLALPNLLEHELCEARLAGAGRPEEENDGRLGDRGPKSRLPQLSLLIGRRRDRPTTGVHSGLGGCDRRLTFLFQLPPPSPCLIPGGDERCDRREGSEHDPHPLDHRRLARSERHAADLRNASVHRSSILHRRNRIECAWVEYHITPARIRSA